jgi:hypothetical protein
MADCPFCLRIGESDLLLGNASCAAFLDSYPVAEGHTLVIPRTHVESFFELPSEDRADLWRLVDQVVELLTIRWPSDGFNIGVNVGKAAGQTIPHAHVHVIPRNIGDVNDPRGGVRWVIPERAKYWD